MVNGNEGSDDNYSILFLTILFMVLAFWPSLSHYWCRSSGHTNSLSPLQLTNIKRVGWIHSFVYFFFVGLLQSDPVAIALWLFYLLFSELI